MKYTFYPKIINIINMTKIMALEMFPRVDESVKLPIHVCERMRDLQE